MQRARHAGGFLGKAAREAARIVGDHARFVDVAVMAPVLPLRHRTPMLVSGPAVAVLLPLLRACGMTPLQGDLDDPASLRRLAGLAHRVVHLAPPPSDKRGDTEHDPRTKALLQALRLRSLPQALVYGSTTGVYGDCQGQRVHETRAVNPHTPRAQRRVDAEALVRFFGRSGVRSSILRVPGIYAEDRLPVERLQRGTPALRPEEDVYTNHIHADDLARIIALAIFRALPQRVLHTVDDSDMRMGDYFDAVADEIGRAHV